MQIATLLKSSTALSIVALLALSACGGGGGGGDGPMTGGMMPGDGDGMMPGDGDGMMPGDGDGMMPGDGDGMMPGDGDGMMPGDGDGMMPGDGYTAESISEEIVQILADATTLNLVTQFAGVVNQDGPLFIGTPNSRVEIPSHAAGEFRPYYINKDANGSPVEYTGITIGRHSFIVTAEDVGLTDVSLSSVDVIVYGGWMDYNYFEMKLISGYDSDAGFVDVVGTYSAGTETGHNPIEAQGGATWRGAALGAIVGYQRKSGVYVGDYFNADSDFVFNADATLTVDFNDETVDAIFDNFTLSDPVLSDDAVPEIDEIEFRDLTLNSGHFSDNNITALNWAPLTPGLELNETKGIDGSFFGPNNEEVGGSFFATTRDPLKQVITGAFGAKRQ